MPRSHRTQLTERALQIFTPREHTPAFLDDEDTGEAGREGTGDIHAAILTGGTGIEQRKPEKPSAIVSNAHLSIRAEMWDGGRVGTLLPIHPMKVMQLLPELNSGGVERGTLELSEFLVAQGHQALVVSNGGRMVAALEACGARHIRLPVHRKNPLSLLQVGPLRRLIEAERPDILHIRSRVPAWITWLAWRKMPLADRPRMVSTVHGFYSVNRYSAVMTCGERVIAVSESIRSYLHQNFPQLDPARIRVVHRGITPENYPTGFVPARAWHDAWRAERPQLADKIVFLLPGRITRLKGHTDFFGLIRRLKESGRPVHGLVVGGAHGKKAAYLEELQQQVRTEGLAADITFLGLRSDMREIMAVSDVVCALSQQPESFGRTVLEALALGKPVLGYDCGGVGELLETIFPAGRVPPGDSALLFQRALAVLTEKPLPHLSPGAFTLAAMCSSTLAIYRELLDSPR